MSGRDNIHDDAFDGLILCRPEAFTRIRRWHRDGAGVVSTKATMSAAIALIISGPPLVRRARPSSPAWCVARCKAAPPQLYPPLDPINLWGLYGVVGGLRGPLGTLLSQEELNEYGLF